MTYALCVLLGKSIYVGFEGFDCGIVEPVPRDLLHITLLYLGNRALSNSELFCLRSKLASVKPFSIVVGGCGIYPSMSKPRALALEVLEGSEHLGLLRRKLLECVRWSRDRYGEFRPHVTVAWIRKKVRSCEDEECILRLCEVLEKVRFNILVREVHYVEFSGLSIRVISSFGLSSKI